MSEKVSVYIPAYNAEKTIEFSLEALFKQTYKPDEIIVINDFSSDSTLKLLNLYVDKIKIINNKMNKGLGFCRNLAIKMSKNKLVASIDADVVPNVDWLKNLLINQYSHSSVYSGGKLIEKNVDENIYNKWRATHLRQHWGNLSIENPPFVFGCNTLLNKNVFSKIGYYDESLKTNGEDVDFSKKLLENGFPTFYVENAICYHIQNDNLKSLAQRYWRYKTFAYKIKKFSYYKFIKLSIKEFKMLIIRIIRDIKLKRYDLIKLELIISSKFIFYEFKETLK